MADGSPAPTPRFSGPTKRPAPTCSMLDQKYSISLAADAAMRRRRVCASLLPRSSRCRLSSWWRATVLTSWQPKVENAGCTASRHGHDGVLQSPRPVTPCGPERPLAAPRAFGELGGDPAPAHTSAHRGHGSRGANPPSWPRPPSTSSPGRSRWPSTASPPAGSPSAPGAAAPPAAWAAASGTTGLPSAARRCAGASGFPAGWGGPWL